MSTPADDVGTQLQQARALCELGRFQEAAEMLRRAISRAPHDRHVWCLLAAAELGAGNPEPALKAAENAIGLAADDEWPHRLASAALRRLDRNEEGIHHAREAVRIEPGSWPAITTLARSLTASGTELPEARDLAARALAIAPDEPETHLTAGLVEAARGNRAAAEAAFRVALSIDPQNTAAHNELARMRMGGRIHTNPAGLADAATGFATSVRINPKAEVGRRNLEHVLRVFLAKTSYLVLIDAYLIARISSSSSQSSARLLPVLVLAIPAGYAWRFIRGLDSTLRQYLLRLVTNDRRILLAVTLESIAIACLIAAALAPESTRAGLAGSAAVSALISRLILLDQTRKTSAAAHGRPATPVLGTTAMWLIAISLMLTALIFLFAGNSSGAGAARITAAALCAAASAGVIYRIKLRRAANHLTTRGQL